jgi:hypothetical protein
MSVMMHEPSVDAPIRQGIASRLLVPGFWATVSIVMMWLAVLFDGVFGGNMTFANGSSSQVTVIPSAVMVALFAMIATVSVAKRAFGRKDAE